MKDKTKNWLLIGNVRYALNRDNGLALSNFKMVVFETINSIKENDYKKYTIKKIMEEIIDDLKYYERNDASKWYELVDKLKELL